MPVHYFLVERTPEMLFNPIQTQFIHLKGGNSMIRISPNLQVRIKYENSCKVFLALCMAKSKLTIIVYFHVDATGDG